MNRFLLQQCTTYLHADDFHHVGGRIFGLGDADFGLLSERMDNVVNRDIFIVTGDTGSNAQYRLMLVAARYRTLFLPSKFRVRKST